MRSVRAYVAVLLVAALVIAGLVAGASIVDRSTQPEADAPRPTATDEPAPTGLERFYAQTLDWGSCSEVTANPTSDDCATLTVPLDYADPAGDTIALSVRRHHATGTAVGPLVVNPGGPGVSAVDFLDDIAYVVGPPLLANFDIVGIDPRGVGHSTPLDCLSDAELDAYIDIDPTPDTPDEVARTVAANDAFAEGCRTRSGALADHVSTLEVARDFDVLRAALGMAQLDYLGWSYGTAIGTAYAALFPDKVGRFVLDGAIDPDVTTEQVVEGQAVGFEHALDQFLAQAGSPTPAELGAWLDGLSEGQPASTPQGARVLTEGLAFYGLVLGLYSPDSYSLLATALHQAMAGDASALLQFADAYLGRSGGRYVDNSVESLTAVNCLDDPGSVPVDEMPGRVAELEAEAPVFGGIMAWSLISCSGWDGVEADRLSHPIAAGSLGVGADPIVVIGTTNDPATPYEQAVALAGDLASGVLVTREGEGHTGYNMGNSCIDDLVHRLFLEGEVPDAGTRCAP